MNGKSFVDSNVIVYGYSRFETAKREKALSIVSEPEAATSIQVLNEFSNVMRKKFKEPHGTIRLALEEIIAGLEIYSFDASTIQSALDIGESTGYSHYDSLILATALQNDCTTLYSEDFQDGQLINGTLRIVNPFNEVT